MQQHLTNVSVRFSLVLSNQAFSLVVDRFLSKWAAIVDIVNNFVVEWRFPAEWSSPA